MKNCIHLALSALSLVGLAACGGGSGSTVSQTPTGFSVEGGLCTFMKVVRLAQRV